MAFILVRVSLLKHLVNLFPINLCLPTYPLICLPTHQPTFLHTYTLNLHQRDDDARQ